MNYAAALRASILAICLSGCSGQTNVQFINDVFGGTDNNYSNGVKLSYSIPEKNMPDVVGAIVDKMPRWSIGVFKEKRVTFTVQQDMFTPDDLQAKDVVLGQNPYAGILTFGIKQVVADEDHRESSEIRIGTSGPPSLADRTQTFIHDTLTELGRNQTHPEGWHNQIATEAIFNFEHGIEWVDKRYAVGICEVVATSDLMLRVGTINADATFSHQYSFGYNAPNMSRTNVQDDFGLYIFGKGFGTTSLHNLAYDGGVFRKSVHTVNSTHLIGGVDVGAAYDYQNYSIKLHYITRTKMYKEQESNLHSFGFLSFGVEW